MAIKGLDKLDKILSQVGNKIKPQLLDGIRDGAKKIRKDYIKKELKPTFENIMKDLTSDTSYLKILEKADISLADIESIVNEVLQNPEIKTFSDDEQYQKALKTGRNQPCPCGSGKKFKKCCGS